jgi:UDP-N-acetylmuramoyl-tripeptide--D-alanyl-D-alanine ligase
MKIVEIYQRFLECKFIVIDTRKITPNCIFLALKGENFDANSFTSLALESGASYVIIDNPDYYIDERTILVANSLVCLQDLASYHRLQLKTPIIALTGSNGKTTTKELINCVLSKKYATTATFGNLNNHIGVPLTLLSFTEQTEMGIVEMGANHQKEIEFLCEIARPDYGYITNFGKAHLEGFGGVEGVIAGKSEMYRYLLKNKKTALINLDDSIQCEKSIGIESITYGLNKKDATVSISKIDANPLVEIEWEGMVIKSNLIGLYNANNINAAITLGKYFGVAADDIKKAIESYVPENNRSQLIRKGSNEIILDAYNANPSSMKVAIENFLQLEKWNKILILGDMFELGEDSKTEHQLIVDTIKDVSGIDCYLIGNFFYGCKIESKHLSFFKSFEALRLELEKKTFENNSILIKGSRGMALERVLDYI